MRDTGGRRRVQLGAPAKLNLSLQVGTQRPDGYHDLRTIFQTVDFGDEMEVSVQHGAPRSVDLRCDRKDLEHRGNHAWRAAHAVLEHIGLQVQVRIVLRKAIPTGAGLGGGSSDAGAALRALVELLDGMLSPALAHEIAASLGSDVPFFLVGGTAAAIGRGTELQPLRDLPRQSVVLLLPPVEVSTAWAYGALAERRRSLTEFDRTNTMGASTWDSGFPAPGAMESPGSWMRNDFEAPVLDHFPLVAECRQLVRAQGATHAMMSGSGSAVFGLFPSSAAARRAADAIAAEGLAEGTRLVVTAFSSRDVHGVAHAAAVQRQAPRSAG